MTVNAWKVVPGDNVAVALENVKAGDRVEAGDEAVTALQDVPQGHKIAMEAIACGDMVKKYGVAIGRASQSIRAGEHVHCHNVADITEELCRTYREAYLAKEAQGV